MKQIILIPIYFFFKCLVWIVLKIYNPFTYVLGRQNLRQKGPLIVISNHPNTLLDPLHVAIRLPRYVYFLANASLFKNPIIGWILNQLYCIPVQRTQDTNGKPLDNKDAFNRSNDFLSKGGCLYVAPEGTSWMEKRLHPLKTGTARIALSFESDKKFQGGLKILPVGLVYDQPNLFGSKVQMQIGTPVEVSTYQHAYLVDPQETVRQLTEDLEEALKSSIIDTETLENERIFNVIQHIYYFQTNDSYPSRVKRSQKIAKELLSLATSRSNEFAQIQSNIIELQEHLVAHKLSLNTYEKLKYPLPALLGFIFLFPVAILGLAFNWFVAALPLLLRKWLQPVIEYHSTFNILGGLIALILVYPFNIYLLERVFQVQLSILSWWLVVFCMLFTGIAAKNWELQLRRYIRHLSWRTFSKKHPHASAQIQATMSKILSFFD